jgi:putative ABC transport system ATP-binding protein/lipoprotein-releasing system ATP-binding protein
LENVSLPLFLAGVPREKAIPLAKETLNMVGLSHRFTFTPKELSGGEKQRVSIARAIVHTPKLILADEPTGNLDSKSSDQIMRLFETCVKTLGITVFIVTHNEEIGKMGNINLRMKDGFLNQ